MPTFLKQVFFIVLVIALPVAFPPLFSIVIGLLIVYSLLGPVHIIKAAALSLTLKYINPALATYDSTAGLLFWILILVSGLRILPLLKNADAKLLPIFAFSLTAILLSLISSPALAVSVMKVITFAWISTTILVAYASLTKSELADISQWLLTFLAIVAVASAVTLLNPHVAHSVIPGSLQGILNQPQSLGTFLAPAAAWLLSSVLLMRTKARLLELAMTALVWVVMVLTLSRTAAVAATAAVIVAIITRVFSGRRVTTQAGFTRLVCSILIGIMSVIGVDAATGKIGDVVNGFVLKRKSNDINVSFYQSRGWGIVSQWQNFLDQPVTGHGFGVYANGEFPKGIVEVAGIPISAPVEKGFLPTAVLEETGIIGACLFIWMVASLARAVWRNTDLRWVAAFSAAILINLGEAAFLSPGGIGLYMWLVAGLCVASGEATGDEEKAEVSIDGPIAHSFVASNLLH